MSASNADDPLPELPTVSTETGGGVNGVSIETRDGVDIVTIVTEGSTRLRVNLNNRTLFEDTVSEASIDAGANPPD
ncbi:hypothetical protein [Rathayibacter sp. VKM Ac-2803]|uniref:hypothetical protein n=1 Tax=Rathayibacter sp. VKM Ac-2803 TaxID=2609256 RepID=UPI00135AB1B8|nr:hypothetical protein [Rathayibacter sp. VKM Ac-2803]